MCCGGEDEDYRSAIAALREYPKVKEKCESAQVVMKAMMLEIDNLKAECERLRKAINCDYALPCSEAEYISRVEEYTALEVKYYAALERAEKAEAKLEKFRPLIEGGEGGKG
jgi:predicted RNase H-like nuclease (RuvC/YqgF family)